MSVARGGIGVKTTRSEAWGQTCRNRNLLLGEELIAYVADGSAPPRTIAPGLIVENSHSSLHPEGDMLLGDTYPGREGRLHLYIYDLCRQVKVDIASVRHGVR